MRYSSGPKQIVISNVRWTLSAIILIGTTLSYYGLFYVIRETVRYMSLTPEYGLWVFTEEEVRFYNTFYAFVSTILGIASGITFLIDRPLSFKKKGIIKTSILNDQRVLNWSFLSWASKLSMFFSFYFISARTEPDFLQIPEYKYLLILICIVLYLQLWTNIIRYIKINKLYFIFIGAMIYVAALLLGSVNLIDYKQINDQILSKNIPYAYGLSLPESNSDYLSIEWRRSRTKKIFQ